MVVSKIITNFKTQTIKTKPTVGTTKGQNTEYKERDFLRSYDEIYKKSKQVVRLQVSEVCRLVAESPAPHFYVTCEWALREYSYWKQNGHIRSNRRMVIEMYKEIFKRFEALCEDYESVSFRNCIMQKVLDGPAPCFYMEPNTAFKFYYRARANKRRRARK